MSALALTDEPVTDHALLALLGHFAQHLGLLDLLSAVPLKQKTVTHAPALTRISQPFIDREVLALLHSQRPLMIDIDLTGRPVSPTSTTYPDAAFGWMDDAVAKGYQSAISSLSGGPSGRLLLASQRYGGRACCPSCSAPLARSRYPYLQVAEPGWYYPRWLARPRQPTR